VGALFEARNRSIDVPGQLSKELCASWICKS
jgi:hypothetical protein